MSEKQGEALSTAPQQSQGQEQSEALSTAPPQGSDKPDEKKTDGSGPAPSEDAPSFRFPQGSSGVTGQPTTGSSGEPARPAVKPDWSVMKQDLVRDKQTTVGVGAALHDSQVNFKHLLSYLTNGRARTPGSYCTARASAVDGTGRES